jgi:alpha-L-arabinofuranosidase
VTRASRLKPRLFGVTILALGAAFPPAGVCQTDSVRLVVHVDSARDTISRHIYGQFAEHLGRGIYDGFWIRGADKRWHLRADVIAALRRIKVPNMRWPGGCFADTYHWKDGVGPRPQRPKIVNTTWGGVTEDNSFGTHEYLELVDRIGAAPFIVGNVGTGTPQEMAQWWEYMNFDGVSPMADLRRRNGRHSPWGVRFWGVGNESWGCGGNMTPEYYADVYKRFATFLPAYGQTRPFRIATGPAGDDYHWTEIVMRDAGRMIDGLDLHYYTVVGTWAKKGSATDFTEQEWFVALEKALHVEELITRHSEVMDRYDPRKRVALIVGEWGLWHDVEPGTNPAFLYQQNTLRDALVAAVSLDVFNRHADRVRGANIAQTINVLQSMILTQGDRMILTPTYHVFDMYSVHQDAVLLPLSIDAGRYELQGRSIPAVSGSASRDKDGRIHLSLVNLDPTHARSVTAELREGGARVSRVAGRMLTAGAINAHNTFEQPDAVQPQAFTGARLAGQRLTLELPAKSIVVLELQ